MSEAFEKWWKQSDYGKPSYKRPNMAIPENVAKAAYTAGLIGAAEIAENATAHTAFQSVKCYLFASRISAAIRKEAGE